MSDYRVTVRVQNNNILSMIQKRGYQSPYAFCNETGFSYQSLNRLINLHNMPIGHDGIFRPTATKLCAILKCVPQELFSDAQMEGSVESNKRTFEVKEAEMRFMLDLKEEPRLLEECVMDSKLPMEIDKALCMLTPREQKVINMRFGVGGSNDSHTLNEVALCMGVTSERVRQIEAKALRKLRHPARSESLREYV